MNNSHDWGDVKAHIERHESGCWTWDGTPIDGNVYRIVAEACGIYFPVGRRQLYRMPDCKLGTECVNPGHIGAGADFGRALNGRRQEIPEPSKAVAELKLTPRDRRFLKNLRVRWE
jgi:hypothetical protein